MRRSKRVTWRQLMVRLMVHRRGTSAIEFALVAPLFILVLITIAAYGIYFSAAVSVQQIAADAARYSIAGITPHERRTLAEAYIRTATLDAPFIEKDRLSVTVTPDPAEPNQFMVSLGYDARALPIWNLFTLPLPSDRIERFATIRVGGA